MRAWNQELRHEDRSYRGQWARANKLWRRHPKSGVKTLTGEGLARVLEGASVVVDVSNSPSFEDAAVMEFFTTSIHNLLASEAAAGAGHHVALSVVGAEGLSEFVKTIADAATDGNTGSRRTCAHPAHGG